MDFVTLLFRIYDWTQRRAMWSRQVGVTSLRFDCRDGPLREQFPPWRERKVGEFIVIRHGVMAAVLTDFAALPECRRGA